jgi:diguanylate cyclase (GGDEF)-like protein
MNLVDLAEKGRILVVDDAMENVRILHQALKDEHDVVFARDGEKALLIAQSQSPDIVLLDAVMPGMDGYSVCAQLKQTAETQNIPVIFVTALNSPEDETRALAAGAVDFITKPINGAVVRARVRTHLTLKRQSDMLRRLTLTDGLTGVANRRCFDETLDSEWRRCQRAGLSLAVILADIDHFKPYNDAYGHQAGDACLAAVAQGLKDCVHRPTDLVARYGGEEFVAVLAPETAAGAQAVAGIMIDRVRALAIPHAHSSCATTVTLSLGVAVVTPTAGSSAAALVAAADARLYQAKAAGRNRCCGDTV